MINFTVTRVFIRLFKFLPSKMKVLQDERKLHFFFMCISSLKIALFLFNFRSTFLLNYHANACNQCLHAIFVSLKYE